MAVSADFTYFCSLLFACTIVTQLLLSLIKSWTKSSTKTRFPGPTSLPIIGHLHLLSSDLPRSLETLASRYGPMMQVRLGPNTVVVISDATIAEEILKAQDVDFSSKYSLAFGLAQFDIYHQDTFFNAKYGSFWRFMKKLCKVQLLTTTQLNHFMHIREQETEKLLRLLLVKSTNGTACELGRELSTMTNTIICRMLMGKRCAENPNLPVEVRKKARAIMESGQKVSFTQIFGPLQKYDLSGRGRRLEDAMWEYDRFMEELMKVYENEKREISEKEGKDVMDILLEAYRDPDAELKLTRNQIKNFFLEVFFASIDTTAATIQYSIAELLNNPQALKKLREEIDTVIGSTRLVKESDVQNLPYLQAVVKESLRRHPPGPLLRRQCNIDTQINGYHIKPGTKFLINTYAIMRDQKTYTEPDKFMPERFLIDHPEVDFKGQHFSFLPFGSGRRSCIGLPHALIVTYATVASLIQCFDLNLKEGDNVDINLSTGYSGAMVLPLVCYPVTRFDPFKA